MSYKIKMTRRVLLGATATENETDDEFKKRVVEHAKNLAILRTTRIVVTGTLFPGEVNQILKHIDEHHKR